jgi:tetratricopeptide (TPR) repeat protein
VSDLRAAAERAPGDAPILYSLGHALWCGGQPLAAVAVLGGILEIESGFKQAIRLRGEILADLGKAERALADLDRARHGQQPSTLAARALAHAMTGRMEAADQAAADAAANGTDDGPALFRVARVRQLADEPQRAAEFAVAALAATATPLPPHLREAAARMLADLA